MALTLLAANNAQTVLAAGISASATSLTVNSGTGSLFPAPSAGVSFFKLTLIDAATGQLTEIMHVTARTGDTMTIERGQEGTTARAWSANDIAANMMTAGTLSYLLTNFQPLDPTLTAIAALVGAANKLPYFNGPDTAALTDLTSVGRDIIGKATAADVVSYLGVGTGWLLGAPKIFLSTGTYTPTPGTNAVLVHALGGGGGGGGCAANPASQASGGQGGGAGAFGAGWYTSGFSGVVVTVGNAGTAGTAGGTSGVNDGGNGGTTAFGSLLSVSGGVGGKSGASLTLVAIGQSATNNTATITGANLFSYPGDDGACAILARTTGVSGGISGRGASSAYGKGAGAISNQGDGLTASGRGAGGSGGISYASAAAQAGGAGTAGIVIIWEYA